MTIPESTREAAAPPDPGSRGPQGNAMLRFTLVTGAWFVGLFGLMRLPWVERVLLTPFAEVQQRVADQLTGVPSDLVYADASCSGGDPLALCAGAIFAFPATWSSRMRGVAVGFTLITAFNVVRLGHLSLIAENRGAARCAARLRVARHPDPGRGGLRLRLDGAAGVRRGGRPPGAIGHGERWRGPWLGRCVRGRTRARSRGAAFPAAGGDPRRDLLRDGADVLRERVRRRGRGVDRGDRGGHPGRHWGDGDGVGCDHPNSARGVHRHPGVHLHPAHPTVRPPRRWRRRWVGGVGRRCSWRRPPCSSRWASRASWCWRCLPRSSARTRSPSTPSRRHWWR